MSRRRRYAAALDALRAEVDRLIQGLAAPLRSPQQREAQRALRARIKAEQQRQPADSTSTGPPRLITASPRWRNHA